MNQSVRSGKQIVVLGKPSLIAALTLVAFFLDIRGSFAQQVELRSGRSAEAVINLALKNPQFAQALRDQTTLLGKLVDNPELMLPNLWPTAMFDAEPGTSEESIRFAAKQVIFDFLNTPDAIVSDMENQQSLRSVLGPENLDIWSRAAESFQEHVHARPELRDRLAHIFSYHRMADLKSLNALFDRAQAPANRMASEITVFENLIGEDGKASKAILSPYLAGKDHLRGTPRIDRYRGLPIAVFDSGDVHFERVDGLRRAVLELHPDVMAIVIQDPSTKEMEQFREDDGWHATAQKVRWVRPVRTNLAGTNEPDPFYRNLPYKVEFLRSDRKKFRQNLNSSNRVRVDVLDVTPERYRNIFFPIYRQMIDEEKESGGKRMIDENWADDEAKTPVGLKAWKLLLFHHPGYEEELVGAVLVNVWRERGFVTLAYGGGLEVAKTPTRRVIGGKRIILGEDEKVSFASGWFNGLGLNLAVRLFHEGMKHAIDNGLGLLSKGMDPNFFVDYRDPFSKHEYDNAMGMISTKAQDGMYPFLNGPLWLLKWINPEPFNEIRFFGLRRDSRLLKRYLHLRDDQGVAPVVHWLFGEPFFGPDSLAIAEEIVLHHYFSGIPSHSGVTLPAGIEVISHK